MTNFGRNLGLGAALTVALTLAAPMARAANVPSSTGRATSATPRPPSEARAARGTPAGSAPAAASRTKAAPRGAKTAKAGQGTPAKVEENAPASETSRPSQRAAVARFLRGVVKDALVDKVISKALDTAAPPAIAFGARAIGVEIAEEFAAGVVPGVMAAVALPGSVRTWRDPNASGAEKVLAGVNLLAGAVAIVPEAGIPAAALGAAAGASQKYLKTRREAAAAQQQP